MILIVGGAGSGKRAYAMSLGYSQSDISRDPFDECPVTDKAHLLAGGGDERLLEALLQKKAVLMDEVGSGIIPADRELRERREAAGRLGVLLAARAERVVRLIAGIPTVIK